jgi:energy-coupling factor transporter ATP-binding protein EcfA2
MEKFLATGPPLPKKNVSQVLDSSKITFSKSEQFLNTKEFAVVEIEDKNVKLFHKDLEIFNGLDTPESSILSKIDKTKTIFGYLKLKETLLKPTTKIETLNDMQLKIKNYLAIQEQDRTQINASLDKLKELESEIIWLFAPKSLEEQRIIESVYFNDHYFGSLNKFEEPLNVYSYFKIFLSPLYGILSPLLMMILPFLYLRFFSNIPINFSLYVKILKASLFGDLFGMMGSARGGNILGGNSGGRIKMSRYFSAFLSIVFYIQNLVNSVNISINTHKVINILHAKLVKFKEFTKISLDLISKLKTPLLLPDCEYPDPFIRDNNFDSAPSLFSNKGRVLYAAKNCLKYSKIKPLLDSVGKIDLFSSIATITKEFDTCFPEIVEHKAPLIEINNLYHPYLGKKATKNSISLGNKRALNAIVTGPNAGGKSTLIKSIGIAIFIAQTLGISFADKLKFTPFDILTSYLNIPDCKGKESLFEAEMHRSLQHIDTCKQLENSQKSFIIMDEIFSSTNPNEGISGAYAIAKKMGSFKNSICIITTHFDKLTDLEKEADSLFKNYKIPCLLGNDRTISYPYKLEEGVSDQHIALDLLESKGFDEDIIREAKHISSNLLNNNSFSNDEKKDLNKNKSNHEATTTEIVEPIATSSEDVAEESVAEESVAEESVAEESVAEESVAEESVAEESVASKEVARSVDTPSVNED